LQMEEVLWVMSASNGPNPCKVWRCFKLYGQANPILNMSAPTPRGWALT
jgi:hypothetical protein